MLALVMTRFPGETLRRQVKRTKVNLKLDPPAAVSKRYSKTLGKYNIGVLGGRSNTLSGSGAGGASSPKGGHDQGSLCVSMRCARVRV